VTTEKKAKENSLAANKIFN